MPVLLDMTDVPMTNILEQCDFKSVLTLRKVCHDLRKFIDVANLKTKLAILRITINQTDFSFRSYLNGLAGEAEHCTSNDLKAILGIQNSALNVFAVANHPENPGALDALEDILRNKPRPLQTGSLEIKVSRGFEVLKILSYLNSKVLNRITISNAHGVREITNLDGIEQILELDQFKNAIGLFIEGFLVNADLKKFFHFERISVNIHKIPLEDLIALKEAFTTSTHMKSFSLREYIMDQKKFKGVFGTPLKYTYRTSKTITYPGKAWYFKIQTCKDHVLEIDFINGTLSFRRVEIADVRKNAIVRD